MPPSMDSKAKLRFVTLLTFARFPLVLLYATLAIVYAEVRNPWLFAGAAASLIVSAITDLFDGYFARKFGVVTDLGKHADPLMDKFFYLATFPVLTYLAARNGHRDHAIVLLVMTMLFLMRDQWVTFLRAIGSLYDASGAANWSGKLRTCITFPLICLIYAHEECPRPFLPAKLLYALEFVGLVVNGISVWIYSQRYWPYLRRSADLTPTAED